MVEKPAFSSARIYSSREVAVDRTPPSTSRAAGGQRSAEFCGGMALPGQSILYSRLGPALDFMLTTNSRVPSALTETELGYHPVGMRPSSCWEATSMTATAFSPPRVT